MEKVSAISSREKSKIITIIKILIILGLLFSVVANVSAGRDYKKEEKIGRRLAERIEKQFELVKDDKALARIKNIGEELKRASKINEINYQFKIVKQDSPNAFALPGGFIYLTEDLLNYIHSDDELAAVIAHEMGHIIHQHSIKQLQDKQKLKLVELLTVLVTGDSTLGLLSELASITILNSYRREYEEEADLTALEILKESKIYHPVALLTYFERVNSEALLKPTVNMGIFKTHPDTSERIKKIKQFLDENDIILDRHLTTNYLIMRGEYSEQNGIFMAQVFINDEPILSFTSIDRESIDLKLDRVITNLEDSLRLDLQSFEITVHTFKGERITSLSIRSKEIVSLSPEEVQDQGIDPEEILKIAKDKIARILWKLKLEQPIFLIDE